MAAKWDVACPNLAALHGPLHSFSHFPTDRSILSAEIVPLCRLGVLDGDEAIDGLNGGYEICQYPRITSMILVTYLPGSFYLASNPETPCRLDTTYDKNYVVVVDWGLRIESAGGERERSDQVEV